MKIKDILKRNSLLTVVIAVILVFGIVYYNLSTGVIQKVKGVQKIVKEGQEQIKKEMDAGISNLEARMSSPIEAGEDMKISTEELFEYRRVESERREEKAEAEKVQGYSLVLDALMGKISAQGISFDYYLERLYKDCDCYNMAQDDLFKFRSSIIAKKNLAEGYKKDIARLQSFGSLDSWDKAELEKKKAYVQNAAKYNLDATDQELLQILLDPKKDHFLLKCVNRAKQAIPILVKYDDTHNLILHFDKIKKTAEYFGIDVDLTVPTMIIEEEKAFSAHMEKWSKEYCAKHSIQCDLLSSESNIYHKVYEKEAFLYIEQMNEKYAALGDNPGLNYAIFTQYRKKMHSPYYDYFKNPKKTSRLHKRFDIYQEDIDKGIVKILSANTIQIGDNIITLKGITLPRKGKVYASIGIIENALPAPNYAVYVDVYNAAKESLHNLLYSASCSRRGNENVYPSQKAYCDVSWDQPWDSEAPPKDYVGKCGYENYDEGKQDLASILVSWGSVYGPEYKKEEQLAKDKLKKQIDDCRAYEKPGMSEQEKNEANHLFMRKCREINTQSIWLEQYLDVKNKKWKADK